MDALQAYASDSDSSVDDEFDSEPHYGQPLEALHPQISELASSSSSFHHDAERLTTMDDYSKSSGKPVTIEPNSPNDLGLDSSQSDKKDVRKVERSSLPPPPSDLLNSLNSSPLIRTTDAHGGRIRSFPHVEGNFALHIYIPVPLSSIVRRQLDPLISKACTLVPELESMEIDLPSHLAHMKSKHIHYSLKLATEFHISLSRTVPIRIHQIDSIVPMLRHKFASQKRYWLEFNQWEVFVNDDQTRSFLALEVTDKGCSEICRQIHSVNEVFRLHNLPTFYQNPRPHISIAWVLGNITLALKNAVEELNKLRSTANSHKTPIWSHLFNEIECKIGNQTYCIWKETMQSKSHF